MNMNRVPNFLFWNLSATARPGSGSRGGGNPGPKAGGSKAGATAKSTLIGSEDIPVVLIPMPKYHYDKMSGHPSPKS